MLVTSARTLLRRRLCSIELLKDSKSRRSGINCSSSTWAAANVEEDAAAASCSSSESVSVASPSVRNNMLRRRRFGIRRNNENRSTKDTDAVELALDSVVKIFTVASSPNYFLPWQNKSQRETMGSGTLSFGFSLTNFSHSAMHTTLLFCHTLKEQKMKLL